MADRTLIKGAIVLTQDPQLGELPGADILIEGDRIAAVGPNLAAADAQVIDAHRRHRHPGLHRHPPPHLGDVDPHLRAGLRADHLLRRHPRPVRAASTGRTTSYAANRWGALECINAGITTLVDWSHIMNTPDHADAAIEGLQDTGIRSVFAFGFPNTSLVTWWFGPDYQGSVRDHRRRPGARPRPQAVPQRRRRPGHDGARHPRHELLQAGRRALRVGAGQGARASTSRSTSRWTASATPRASSPGLRDLDLLYPNTTYIHASHLTDEEWLLVRDSGGNVSLAPADRGPDGPRLGARAEGRVAGHPGRASAPTWRPPRPPTSSPRCTPIFGSERGRRHQASWDEDLDGLEPTPGPHHGPPGPPLGDASTAPRSPASPTGPARSRPARRPTS